jgi:hypothetical protein
MMTKTETTAPAAIAPDGATTGMKDPKTITLKKSGIVVTYDADFSTADTISAQRAAGKESSNFVLYLLQRIGLFNGRKFTMAEIKEKIRGKDYLQLTAAVLGDDDDEPKVTEGN